MYILYHILADMPTSCTWVGNAPFKSLSKRSLSHPKPRRRHTASRLAEEGARVIVHGRREAAVKEAVEFVKGKGNGQSVEGIVADVSSLRGMNHLCDEVLARTDRLDCLLNNAGERGRACTLLVL